MFRISSLCLKTVSITTHGQNVLGVNIVSFSTFTNNNQNINPRRCVYGCGIQIYWNSSVNEYWEVFTKKKHICPNRGKKSSGTITTTNGITPSLTAQKPRYYNPSAKK